MMAPSQLAGWRNPHARPPTQSTIINAAAMPPIFVTLVRNGTLALMLPNV